MKINKVASTLFIIISVIGLLIVGKVFLLPLIIAILIWFLIKEIRRILTKMPIVGKKAPIWVLSLLSTITLFSVSGIMIALVIDNINYLSNNTELYEQNIKLINARFQSDFDIDLPELFGTYIGDFDFISILNKLLKSITDLFSNAFIVGFYVLFLFVEENIFKQKLSALYPKSTKYKDVNQTLQKINNAISKYISLKTFVSLISAISCFIALVIIGVDTPLFWAFLIFTLNYIPVVGAFIAVIFPSAIALFQFGDFTHFFMVLGIIGSIQMIVGNVLEPKIMGNSLNVSSLVVIIALSFWGIVWGVVGMILSVPITVVLIILFAQFPSTKSIAILLSEKGKV